MHNKQRKFEVSLLGEDEQPHANVTVQKTSGSKVATNEQDVFTISIKQENIITASMMGYNNAEILYKNEKSLRFVLVAQEKNLDEVVVIGYGTIKRRNLVGAVDQISGNTIKLSQSHVVIIVNAPIGTSTV